MIQPSTLQTCGAQLHAEKFLLGYENQRSSLKHKIKGAFDILMIKVQEVLTQGNVLYHNCIALGHSSPP